MSLTRARDWHRPRVREGAARFTWDGGQVPGAGGDRRLLLDGELERGGLPRLDFLFSRNRLNVAVSRTRCLAYLVASPRLLDTECRTVEQVKLVNALCRFAEIAEGG
jgi:hypothetical protein